MKLYPFTYINIKLRINLQVKMQTLIVLISFRCRRRHHCSFQKHHFHQQWNPINRHLQECQVY